MEGKVYFSEKLNNILFLDIKKETLMKIFNIYLNEDIYMPIKSNKIIEDIKNGKSLDEIPITFFIEGMFYVLGIDEHFRYADYYVKMLSNIQNSISFIKSIIFNEVKKEFYEEAFIFLNGLVKVEENEENYDKLLTLADVIRQKDKNFKDEELYIIDKAKIVGNSPLPYLYEAIIKRDEGNYEFALVSINTYLSKGGKKTEEISEFIHSLNNIINFEKGKELLYEDANKALKLLIPLLDEYGDNASLYYYIAVGYRILENFEKAIYYLNEALGLDNALVEVVNELGINYAALEDYETAIKYLRKAFEATKSVEICTNLIMCYINIGDMDQAKNHLDIAKKLNSKDEIVIELDKIINGKK
ncbi:Tetratricopeptide repeat-containing protein [Clostridium sp. USBA 49]|uniref:tetratricopeptide repeat protein n=1 Tax=Clostridium TaxID=1485 RepID=UPI00099914D5|nr:MULTISPECIES: tetratricopeptide repeat protein [Clostridium]SKA88168.1 Tetratricopeptide repeat-containing protein [Clostridium sp. USBA 49]